MLIAFSFIVLIVPRNLLWVASDWNIDHVVRSVKGTLLMTVFSLLE